MCTVKFSGHSVSRFRALVHSAGLSAAAIAGAISIRHGAGQRQPDRRCLNLMAY